MNLGCSDTGRMNMGKRRKSPPPAPPQVLENRAVLVPPAGRH